MPVSGLPPSEGALISSSDAPYRKNFGRSESLVLNGSRSGGKTTTSKQCHWGRKQCARPRFRFREGNSVVGVAEDLVRGVGIREI